MRASRSTLHGSSRPWFVVASALLTVGILNACSSNAPGTATEPSQTENRTGAAELRVQEDPLRIWLERDGETIIGTAASRQRLPAPVPVGVLDLTEPESNLLAGLGDAPFGWINGARIRLEFPASLFQGNQLLWVEAGSYVAVTGVESVERTADGWVLALQTNALPPNATARLTITRLADNSYRWHLTPPEGMDPVSTLIALDSPAEEGLFGLGARKDAFNQRGRIRNVWTEQQNTGAGPLDQVADVVFGPEWTFPNGGQAAYWVESAVFGSRGWGGWLAQSEVARWDLAASDSEQLRLLVAAPEMTLTLNADGLQAASRAYTGAFGRAPAPPRYVYEPWVDVINEGEGEAAPNGQGFRGGERVRAEVETIVERSEALDIPFGVIGMEGWQSVPGIDAFVDTLKAKGYRVAGYWNMFTSEDADPETPERKAAYEEALAKDLFVRGPSGEPYPVVTNRGGRSFLIDYTHPEAAAYWEKQLRRMFDLGIEAFMHDFGELIITGMRFADGTGSPQTHNRYPRLYHAAARRACDRYEAEHPEFECFFYARAGFTGTSAYTPSVFPGDESTDWEEGGGLPSVIPAMLNLSLTGAYAFTTDVGGYFDAITPQTSKELFIRWSQLAAFTPVLRLHNSTFNGSVRPWDFDDETVEIFRRFARAKIQLIDLVDEHAQQAATTGHIGPIRPIVLEDRSAEAMRVDDQWLLGEDLLVAPVTTEGARSRSVYFPAGSRWQRLRVTETGALAPEGASFEGRTRADIDVPLDTIAVFRRTS